MNTATLPGIYRTKLSFEQGFTRIPNSWLRDNRIGFRAKGLLAYLLSHEVGYTITLGQIQRETGDGRSAIRSAVDELEHAGYLQTKRTHDERGWNAGLAWILQDPNPECENPTLENPTLENRTTLEENLNKKKTKEEVNPQPSVEEAFNFFWQAYPRKVEKIDARKAFVAALKVATEKELLDGVRRLATDPNLPQKNFIPYPASWLRAGGWTNEPYPERVLSAEEKKQKEADALAHRREAERMAMERQREEWQRIEAEAKANPAPRCEHGRIEVMCQQCGVPRSR